MIGKKAALSRLLRYTGLGVPSRMLRGDLVVFNYHRIKATDDDRTAFDSGVFGPSVAQFERQVRWLRSNADLLTEAELLDVLDGKVRRPKRPALITFDDGYKDNHALAFPVLRRLGCSAIFFIPIDPLVERSLGWWDLISYVIKQSPNSRLSVLGREYRLPRERTDAIRDCLGFMKTSKWPRSRGFVDALAGLCGVPLPGRDLQDAELMTVEDIREMHAAGMGIGSHTVSHRVLATLGADEQSRELRESLHRLERLVDGKVRSLAYPVGNYAHFTPETKALARAAGYEAAFSFDTGSNDLDAIDRYDLRRVCAPDEVDMLAAMLSFPRVFSRPVPVAA